MKLKLERFERDHALWRKIAEAVDEEIATLRKKNDNPLDVVQTASTRGRIAALKDLLAIAEDVRTDD